MIKKWNNKNGELHREDGHAVEYASGSKEWWINGLRHREDGPAIENFDAINRGIKMENYIEKMVLL